MRRARFSSLGFVAVLASAIACDTEGGVPDDLVIEHGDGRGDGSDEDRPSPERTEQALEACDWLGADRTCGADGDDIQFCAWLIDDASGEIAKYWGECIESPECDLWSCRAADEALCDLVDGRPQWVVGGCDGWRG